MNVIHSFVGHVLYTTLSYNSPRTRFWIWIWISQVNMCPLAEILRHIAWRSIHLELINDATINDLDIVTLRNWLLRLRRSMRRAPIKSEANLDWKVGMPGNPTENPFHNRAYYPHCVKMFGWPCLIFLFQWCIMILYIRKIMTKSGHILWSL